MPKASARPRVDGELTCLQGSRALVFLKASGYACLQADGSTEGSQRRENWMLNHLVVTAVLKGEYRAWAQV